MGRCPDPMMTGSRWWADSGELQDVAEYTEVAVVPATGDGVHANKVCTAPHPDEFGDIVTTQLLPEPARLRQPVEVV